MNDKTLEFIRNYNHNEIDGYIKEDIEFTIYYNHPKNPNSVIPIRIQFNYLTVFKHFM